MPACKHTLIAFLTLACMVLHAQILPHEKYTSKNGLVSDRITAIAQDQQGFMWFGSYFGICRYDGLKFEKIPLPPIQQNKFVSFITAVGAKVYAGFLFNGGLVEIDNGKIQSYYLKDRVNSSNEFTCLCENENGSVFVCNTSNEIFLFQDGQFTHLLTLAQKPGNYPKIIQKDRNNNLWIATDDCLFISAYPYKQYREYFGRQGISSLVKDRDNDIWFSTTGGQNTLQTCKGWKSGNFVDLHTVYAGKLVPVAFQGNMTKGYWYIDYSKKLVNIPTAGEVPVMKYNIPVDLNTDISAMFCDRENNIWIANEPGVIKISNFNIQSYPFDELAIGGGALLQLDDSLLWATNSRAIYSVNHLFRKLNLPVKTSSPIGKLLVDKKKNTWISLWDGGVWCLKWENGKCISKKFFSEFDHAKITAQQLVSDSFGNVWIGGINGLFRFYDEQPMDHYKPINAFGSPSFITALTIDEQERTLWVGDNAAGVVKIHYSIEGNRCSYIPAGFITNRNKLGDMYVRSLLLDKKKNLWIGTRYGGIFRLNTKANQQVVSDESVAAQLKCTRITDINAADSNLVWFATCDGIYSYRYDNNSWHHYNTADGLLNAEIFNVLADVKHNCIWTLSSQGITRMQLEKQTADVLPTVNISSVNVLGKTDSSALLSADAKKYSNSENSLGFTFIAPSFIDERKVRYRYRLKGYEKEWSEPVATNSVNYASLPPGNYTFEVIACNAKGQWTNQPATFRFNIVMPFYKSSSFYFLLILLLFSIIYLVRLQQLKNRYKIERLRLSIARDLHDDVGATLGSINILSKTAARKLQSQTVPTEIDAIFHKIGNSAEHTLEAMDDIVWSINPGKDKLQDLLVRMREYAIPLFEARNIAFRFKTGGDLSETLSMNLRRNLFLVFKESVHNILKHSEAASVSVMLENRNQQIHQVITDDGKGFNVEAVTNRNGLKNIKQRAAMINASLQISSSPAGTEIRLSGPLR